MEESLLCENANNITNTRIKGGKRDGIKFKSLVFDMLLTSEFSWSEIFDRDFFSKLYILISR